MNPSPNASIRALCFALAVNAESVTGGSGGTGVPELDYEAVANSTGNFTVTPDEGVKRHTVQVTVTGTASTRIAILATAGRVAGDEVAFDFVLPDTASIVLELRDATSGGTLVYTRTTTATEATDGYHWRVNVRFNGTAWIAAGELYPSS